VTCRECRFSSDACQDSWKDDSGQVRECWANHHYSYYLECNCPKFNYETMDRDGLMYWDYEGYAAGINVGPDFGCVHFESVEQK
jgi:hypothetical protein